MPPEANRTLLLQFAKSPVLGEVKTRMIPHLSPRQALDLHCELVVRTTRSLVESGLGPVHLAVAGDTSHPLFDTCRDLGVSRVTRQSGAGLGKRMYRALRDGLEEFDAVILVGSDCPELDPRYLAAAARALSRVEIVLGPAADGGYVLIGAREIIPEVFRGIEWGSSSVYRQTVARLTEEAVPWAALSVMRDIDRPQDLPYWKAVCGGRQPDSRQCPGPY